MLSDMEAMELLCRGHALEWTGQGWKVALEPQDAAITVQREKRGADVAWLVGAPTTAIEHVVCAESRTAALLRDASVNRLWC
jgi:hypothetical protein